MDSLPNEVLLKIVKMAASSEVYMCPTASHTGICGHEFGGGLGEGWIHDDRHDFLVDVVSRISKRFKSLAEAPGTQFNRKYFGLKNGLRLDFDYDTCLNV